VLKITLPGDEFFDDETQEFITKNDVILELEHSLASLSKWESIWEKPFLSKETKSTEETISYIVCMMLTEDLSVETLSRITSENFAEINAYIDAKMTATWFNDKAESSREIITAELIYYWMVSLKIPFECQHWHLNRLFTLIRVCNQKNSPPKKLSRSELAARNRALNAQRKAQLNTKG
jgi:hypothetical protein